MMSLGETAGFTVVQRKKGAAGGWDETPTALHDGPEGPAQIMDNYQEDHPENEYAVVRLQIIFTSGT